MKISGEVGIAKKSGEMKWMPWEHTIKIMKPEGTVSLPDMQVLYQGYANKVKGVASGYDKSTITASGGVSLSKSAGNIWVAKPTGAGRTASLTIIGQNSITKNPTQTKWTIR
jgi:hypothetical protein